MHAKYSFNDTRVNFVVSALEIFFTNGSFFDTQPGTAVQCALLRDRSTLIVIWITAL